MDEVRKDELPDITATPPGMNVFLGPQPPAPAPVPQPAGWGSVGGGVNPQAVPSPEPGGER